MNYDEDTFITELVNGQHDLRNCTSDLEADVSPESLALTVVVYDERD